MIPVIYILGLVASVMFVICVTPSNCRKQNHVDRSTGENESNEDESTLVQIKVTDLRPSEIHGKMANGDSNREHSSIGLNRNEEQNAIARESVCSGEARLVPVKVYTYKHRVSGGRIWSTKLKDQLQNITNSSSEVCGSTRIVRAQIEKKPASSSSIEPVDTLASNHGNCLRRVSVPNHGTDEKTRKLSSAVIKKYKSLKKIIRPRSQKLLSGHTNSDGTQKVSTQTLTPLEQCSTILRKNVSTSTRLSVNGSNVKSRNDELAVRHDSENDETAIHLRPDSHQSTTGSFQEMIFLIRRETTNGKSICDLKINGLSMNQSQLSELFKAAEGVDRSASIVATEEASVLTIKFNRRKETSERPGRNDTSFYECPLTTFYRSLPQIFEDLSISKLFRSDDVPTKHSCHNHLRNDSSYKSLPNRFNRQVG